MRTLPLIALSLSALSLAACSTAIEAVKGPELAPIGYPAALVPVEQAYLPEPTSASANSLWRTGARSFFGDQRARRVGDILTVAIDINDRAQTQNATQRNRSNSASGGVTNFFGLENSLGRAFPGGFDPANMILYGTGNPIEALMKVGQYVKSVHCKDAKWAADGHRGQAWGREVALGDGDVGFELYLRVLKSFGYDGPLTIEREIPHDRAQQKKDIGQAVALLEKLRAKIG